MNPSIYELPVDNVASYLQSEGWTLVTNNKVLYAFEGFKDADGDTLEIILPKNVDAPDYCTYVQHSINLVAALTDKVPTKIANDILLYDRDLLKVRVTEETDRSSISLDLAAKHIEALKKLVRFAASSESNAKPYFDQPSSAANKMMQHFRFGHTFAGSFGYLIESPVEEAKPFHSKPQQLELELPLPLLVPLQRRVMERIARGLRATEKAAESRDEKPLIKGYAEGFNANMCDAIIKMVEELNEPIEISITWSKKIEATNGIKQVRNIRIGQQHFRYLEAASKQLKKLKPTFETIEGRVIGLSSLGDPQSDDVAERSVIVQPTQGKRRVRKVRINLAKDDYIKAHDAHLNWNTISVSGILQKQGALRQLYDPQDFKIVN